MINKYREKLTSLGLNFRSELLKLIIPISMLIIFSVIMPLLFKNLLLAILPILFTLAYFVFYVFRITNIEKEQKEKLIYDFVELFSLFKIYIFNGYNVYSSLKEIKEFANPYLCKKLNDLIERIDEDKSILPFIEFSKCFNNPSIEQILFATYAMIDDGGDKTTFVRFEMIFDKFADIVYANRIEKKEKKISSLTITALIGAGLLIVLVTFGVIGIIGDMVNVL